MAVDPDPSLDIDFLTLAIQDADFSKLYHSNDGAVNFRDPEHVQQLTKATLRTKFKLNVELPSDRLCPPVPIRYEYIRWLHRLIDSTTDDYGTAFDSERRVTGIDIGTGATCIYPLLGCSTQPNWRFIATELDDKSFDYAERNIKANNLTDRIDLRKALSSGPILPLHDLELAPADFVMCNPPFYTSESAMDAACAAKSKPPFAICTGAPVEMICEGGDLGFMQRILEESRTLGSRVQWYSCMLGKLHSAQVFISDLREAGIKNWALTSLQAGHRTKRWVVAWSFVALRPLNDVARGDAVARELLCFPTELSVTGLVALQEELKTHLDTVLGALRLSWKWTEDASGLCLARTNVWSRAARRQQQRRDAAVAAAAAAAAAQGDTTTPGADQDGEKKQQQLGEKANDAKDESDHDDSPHALAVRITLNAAAGCCTLRWLRGHDQVLWESFCGMVRRELIKAFASGTLSAEETDTASAATTTATTSGKRKREE